MSKLEDLPREGVLTFRSIDYACAHHEKKQSNQKYLISKREKETLKKKCERFKPTC